MKHFKLNIENKLIPVADLCIAQVSEEDHVAALKAFSHVLIDSHIAFDIIEKENQTFVAKKKETTWSISE